MPNGWPVARRQQAQETPPASPDGVHTCAKPQRSDVTFQTKQRIRPQAELALARTSRIGHAHRRRLLPRCRAKTIRHAASRRGADGVDELGTTMRHRRLNHVRFAEVLLDTTALYQQRLARRVQPVHPDVPGFPYRTISGASPSSTCRTEKGSLTGCSVSEPCRVHLSRVRGFLPLGMRPSEMPAFC
jgi:hypothetical protein